MKPVSIEDSPNGGKRQDSGYFGRIVRVANMQVIDSWGQTKDYAQYIAVCRNQKYANIELIKWDVSEILI